MKIYISGKISGLTLKSAIKKFKWHAGFLELKGHAKELGLQILFEGEFKTNI